MPGATRAVLFVVDGLRPDALPRAPTPHIDALIARGASTMAARVTVPSVTLPCHVSLFFACGPERHGVTTNTWVLPVPPIPSLFEVARHAGLEAAAFYTWEQLRDLAPPGTLDTAYYRRLDEPADNHVLDTAAAAAAYVAQQPPGLCFVYLEAADQAEHRFGWMSDRYLAAVTQCDRAIGTVVGALDRADILAETAIALTSDHGGHDHSHGTETPEDMTVPWILAGPGTAVEGCRLPSSATIVGTVPSLLYQLGIEMPAEWLGSTARQAFVAPARKALGPPVSRAGAAGR
ncbi:MAG TPA: alkaline phosphatase family protein [Anaerolineae bacterium]|nr:alkaline phosphatase family protein [Anaerolineae bacterium]